MKKFEAARRRFCRAFLAWLGRGQRDAAETVLETAVDVPEGVSRARQDAAINTAGVGASSLRSETVANKEQQGGVRPVVVAAEKPLGPNDHQPWGMQNTQTPASQLAPVGTAPGVGTPLGIFWDIENCSLPSDAAADTVAFNVRRALRLNPSTQEMCIGEFAAYGDFNMFPRRIREGCQRTGINLLDVPNGRKDAADKAILADLFLFALDHPPPAAILLISGDVDFATSLHKLGQRGYSIFLAVPGHASVSRCLTSAALHVWEWGSLARGEGLQPVASSSMPSRRDSAAVGPTGALSGHIDAGRSAKRKGKDLINDPLGVDNEHTAGFKDKDPDDDSDSDSSFNILDQSLLSSDLTDWGEESSSPTPSGPDLARQELPLRGYDSEDGSIEGAVKVPFGGGSGMPPRMFASNRQGDLEVLRSQLCHIVQMNGGRVALVNVPSEYRKVFGTPFYLCDYGASKIANLISRMKGSLQIEGTGTRKWLVLGAKGREGSPSGSDSDGSSACGRRGYAASQCSGCTVCAQMDLEPVEPLNASALFQGEGPEGPSFSGGSSLRVGDEEDPITPVPPEHGAALGRRASGSRDTSSALAELTPSGILPSAAHVTGSNPADNAAQVPGTEGTPLSTNQAPRDLPSAYGQGPAVLPPAYRQGTQSAPTTGGPDSAYHIGNVAFEAQLLQATPLTLDQPSAELDSEQSQSAMHLDSRPCPMLLTSSSSDTPSLLPVAPRGCEGVQATAKGCRAPSYRGQRRVGLPRGGSASGRSGGLLPRAPRCGGAEPLAVFWDIENCCLPSDVSAESVGVNVRLALREHEATANCPITVFSAYGDFSLLPRRIREGCQRTGINLHDVPNGRKDAADKAILADLFLFALDHPPPATILVITSDVDFATALQKLSQRRYCILLAVLSNGIVSRYLTSAADHVWDWRLMARGQGAVHARTVSSRDDRARLSGMWAGADVQRHEDGLDSCSPCDSSSGSEASGLVSDPSMPDAEDDESWDDSFHQLYAL